MKVDCPRAARAWALPWPKRCFWSGGISDQRTANRFNSEAPASMVESTREASTLTEPVMSQATALARMSSTAVVTEA
jgi:hypothetical protein